MHTLVEEMKTAKANHTMSNDLMPSSSAFYYLVKRRKKEASEQKEKRKDCSYSNTKI